MFCHAGTRLCSSLRAPWGRRTAGRAGSGVGSLPVSPPASDQTPGGSFPLTKKAALLLRLPQTREAPQLLRSPVRRQHHADNSTESCAGISALFIRAIWITSTSTPSAVHPAPSCPSWWSDTGIGGEYFTENRSWGDAAARWGFFFFFFIERSLISGF